MTYILIIILGTGENDKVYQFDKRIVEKMRFSRNFLGSLSIKVSLFQRLIFSGQGTYFWTMGPLRLLKMRN